MKKNRITTSPICLLLIVCYLLPVAYVHSQFTITPSITNATCPDSANGSINISVSGGAPPYTYLWTPNGQTSSSISGIPPNTYSVTITDNSGNDTTVVYVVGPPPITIADVQNPPHCTHNGSIIILSVSGGSGGYQFLWSTGATNNAIINIGAGNYSVQISDSKNCTKTFSYTVKELECFIRPETFFTPNDDGINDTWYIENAQYFPNAHLIIFNRWGTKVYEHKGLYEPWDGKSYLGIPVPDAVYYFFFYQDKDDKQKDAVTGSVTILR
jgi:gliding motility-associated-like protein